jgi:hypothetical protein
VPPAYYRVPDLLIIEKAVQEHDGAAASAVAAEHDLAVQDRG